MNIQPDQGQNTNRSNEFSPESMLSRLEAGEKIDLSAIPRQERLSVINDFLKSQNLKPLAGLGDASEGQIEFTGINGFSPDPVQPGKFLTRVDFQATVGAGEKTIQFNHLCMINANTAELSGVVIAPVIRVGGSDEMYVALVQQFRPVQGETTLEVPRGFPDPKDLMASKPFQGAMRELQEETKLLDDGQKINTVALGTSAENTGTSNISNDVVAVVIDISAEDFEKIQSRVVSDHETGQQIGTVLVPLEKSMGFVTDAHSQAALGMLSSSLANTPDMFA